MNDCDELSISSRLASGGLPPEEALGYATGLAQALRRMHQKGTVCECLDPDHILLNQAGVTLVQNGAGGGLTPYTAPEWVLGEDLDARSNIFSFGAVVYELLSGRKAFSAHDPEELKREILEHQPAPLPDVSREVALVLGRCLEKSRDNRWQRMSSVLIELKLAIATARHSQQAAEWKEKMSSQRAHLAGLEGRLTAHQSAHQETVSELRQLIRDLECQAGQQLTENAKTAEALAALRESVASLQKTTQVQTQAIESIEAAAAQTDEVVEHVVDAFGLMHKSMVERAEVKLAASIARNGN